MIRLNTQNITNMYTPIELISTNIGQVAYHGGGGITDHGYLHGLGDNDHPQYLLSSRSTQFMPADNSVSYQYLSNSNLSLGTGASASFMQTNNSSTYVFAKSNSNIFALSNHTHTGLGGAASDHSHGSVYITSTAGTDINIVSNSSGLSIAVPNYLTTAYGAAIQGSGSYSQNIGTIQFVNSNGVSFGLETDGIMTASVPAVGGAQTGISAIAGSAASSVTDGTIQFANANGISFGLNSNTMTASYTVPAATVFSSSNNVEFGLSGSTITALAVFAQTTQTQNLFNLTLSGNTSGTMTQVSSGTLTLYGGSNITLSQSGNKVTIHGSAGVSNSHNVTVGGNSTSAGAGYIEISSGSLTLAGGNNITLSQNGNAITISGANLGGAQTGISGIIASNTTYSSGSVIWSGQNNITIGSYATSDSQYVRLSVGNYLTTAAASTHTHGSAPSITGSIGVTSNSNAWSISIPSFLTTAALSQNTSNYAGLSTGSQSANSSVTDIKFTLNTAGLNLAIPKYITAPGAHTHGGLNLNLTNLGGSYSSASDGLTISLTGYPATSFAAATDIGNIYFGGGSNILWGSSIDGNSTTVMATAGGGSGGSGMALAFSGNTAGTTQTLGGGTVQFVGGNNITLSQAGSIITISAGASGGAADWATSTLSSGTVVQISTGLTNTFYYPKFITTYSAGTGMGTGLSTTAANMTVNSNGISFNGNRYGGTGFTSTNITGSNVSASISTDGLKLWVPNYLTTQTLPSNTVSFVDGGGITWGTSAGTNTNITVITATVAGGTGGSSYVFSNANGVTFGLTGNTVTASIVTAHTQYAGILATGVTGASATINSSQIQLNIPVGSIYFADSNGHSFSSSVNGVSTTIYIVT
jgi:hypothetical protein